MITDLTLPALTSASRRLASLWRKRSSSWSCQLVCSMALRRLSMELIDRPGASVPCSLVLASGCSWTSRVLRLRSLVSPTFSSTSAFLPLQTTTQSPRRTSILDMPTSSIKPFILFNIVTQRHCCTLTRVKRRRRASVALLQQPPRNHIRLNLSCALEDREDARVAEQPRHRELQRKAVAAVDLHRIVGGRPGDPC